jgi:hypothetical protein
LSIVQTTEKLYSFTGLRGFWLKRARDWGKYFIFLFGLALKKEDNLLKLKDNSFFKKIN